jgi:purine-nucleoside/S-methyl-5'-thioadenosine phosphorylase / adenosine deaminase
MTAHTRPLPASGMPAGCTVMRVAGPLRLLTWPALDASGLDAAVTARQGGVSSGPYATLNLSLSVGDDPASVLENRRRLAAALGASPGDFVFARQVHGAGVRVVGQADRGHGAFSLDDAIGDADALVTRSSGLVLAILAADCVPVVLHDPVAGVLACVHAGWRGTAAGVPAAAVAAMRDLGSRPADVIAGIGPAIAPARYQVGSDVYQAITRAFGPAADALIRKDPGAPDRWLLDLPAASRLALRRSGVPASQIHATSLPTGPQHPPHPPHPPHSPSSADPTGLTDPADHAGHGYYFFSDRTARPCGRHALIARLRGKAGHPFQGSGEDLADHAVADG